MEYTARGFKHPLLCLLCLATVDLEPDLISMQNKYTRGWYNCILCDITVSGGWHNCFRRDLAFFSVDIYICFICDITWKLIQKCYIICFPTYTVAVSQQTRTVGSPGYHHANTISNNTEKLNKTFSL